jgi:ferric-dicitrate binding protein FerR (iron transport regulator)
MSSNVDTELVRFHHFVAVKLSENTIDLSPEEALELWRAEHPRHEEFDDATDALKEAFADIEAGDHGMPFEDFEREFRKKYGLEAKP